MKPKAKDSHDILLERIEFSELQVFELRYQAKMNKLIEDETKELAPKLMYAKIDF